MVPKVCQDCIHHEQIAFQLERLTMRTDRIEVVGVGSIVSFLIAIIVQLWMLSGIPERVRAEAMAARQSEIRMIVEELKEK